MEAPAEGEAVVFPCLEELDISHCPNLGNASASRFPRLKTLKIYQTGLTCLPEGMLEYLEIRGCGELTSIAPDVFGCLGSLRSLIVIDCEKLSQLPDGLDKLPHLEVLSIGGCPSLKSIRITQDEHNLLPLEELTIHECPNLESIQITPGIESLRVLNIDGCEVLSILEVGLRKCTSLQRLTIADCRRLLSLPSGLQFCTSLRVLAISGCSGLTSIPITQGIPSLQRLRIVNCCRLLSLPSGLQFCTSLQHLQIGRCSSLVSISVSYHVCDHQVSTIQPDEVYRGVVEYCRSLKSIQADLRQSLICNCGKLKYEPTGFRSLTSLKNLSIGPFWKELDAFPDFQLPPGSQLEELRLLGWPKLKSLPQQIQHSTCLKSLSICDFLRLEALPEWLGNLTSLEALDIQHCRFLKSLPAQDAMKSLTELKKLYINTCLLLEKRCIKEAGPEWPKISHIPKIECWPGTYGNAETSTSSPINAENSTSSPRNAENLTSFPRNVVLDCLPCCFL